MSRRLKPQLLSMEIQKWEKSELIQLGMFKSYKLLLTHFPMCCMLICLNELNITSSKFNFSFLKIASSLLYLIIYLPNPIALSTPPLKSGEYTGVYVYRKPSSFILSLTSLDLCKDRLSIIMMMSSPKCLLLKFSKNILNFALLTESLKTYI